MMKPEVISNLDQNLNKIKGQAEQGIIRIDDVLAKLDLDDFKGNDSDLSDIEFSGEQDLDLTGINMV